MIRFIFGLIFLFSTTSFADNGKIQVFAPITLKVKKGLSEVAPGEYDIKVKEKNSKAYRMEISIAGKDNNPVFDLKLNKKIPVNGSFAAEAVANGQNYNVSGNNTYSFSYSGVFWGNEICRVQVAVKYCWIDGYGHKVCEIRYEYRDGYQDVRYRYRDEERTSEMLFVVPETNVERALIQTFDEARVKEIISMGPCRAY